MSINQPPNNNSDFTCSVISKDWDLVSDTNSSELIYRLNIALGIQFPSLSFIIEQIDIISKAEDKNFSLISLILAFAKEIEKSILSDNQSENYSLIQEDVAFDIKKTSSPTFNIKQNEQGYFLESTLEIIIYGNLQLDYEGVIPHLIGQITYMITRFILYTFLDDCYAFLDETINLFPLQCTYSEDNLIESLTVQEPISGIPKF